MDAETRLNVLSKIKKEIINLQKDREQIMIEFLKLKRKLASVNQLLGNKQRQMLEAIP